MKNYLKAFLAVGAFLFASVGLADTTGELNSENFEGLTAGDSLNVKTAATDGSILWASGDADVEGSMGEFAVVTAYETESESGGKNYLALETTNPLYRHVQGGGTAQDIGTGLYFEGDVQFSPYEEDVDTSEYKENGTKLLVYIKGTETTTDDNENEVKGTTNFVVVAGYYNNDNDVAEIKNYVCEAPSGFDYNKDTWHHLLLKAYLTTDESCSYFKVFVDGTALTCTEEKGSSESSMANIGAEGFPSMTKGSATTLKDVGFKGTGKVDNLVWTTVDPLPTTLTYVFTWDSVQGTPVVKIGNDKQDIEAGVEYTYTEAQVKTMTLAFDTNGWYVNGIYSETKDDVTGVTTVSFTATKAAVSMQIGEASVEYYETLDDVMSYLSKNVQEKSTTVSIVLGADVNLSGNYSFYDNAPTTIIDLNGQNITLGTLEGCTLTINNSQSKYGYVTGKVSADILYINGGAFSEEPSADTLNTGDKKLATTTIDGTTWYVLVDDGGSTEPTIDGGEVDPTTKTITVDSSDSGEITITGDASEYTISVPQNVTKITGSVGTITIMGKSESMTTAVDITGAFSVTTENNVTTIALDKDASVTFTNSDGESVTVKVTPELDTTTDGTEPFAVGDSVSATVKAIPGLTYSLMSSTDVSTVKASTTSECTKTADASGTVKLEDTTTDKPAAKFYVIKVSR